MSPWTRALWAYLKGVSAEATSAGGVPLMLAALSRVHAGDAAAWTEFWGGLLFVLVPQSETKKAVLEAWYGAEDNGN